MRPSEAGDDRVLELDRALLGIEATCSTSLNRTRCPSALVTSAFRPNATIARVDVVVSLVCTCSVPVKTGRPGASGVNVASSALIWR